MADSDATTEGDNIPSITPEDRRFLGRVSRFLLHIQTPTRVRRARREGYTTKEHQHGWELWSVAAGKNRSLDHFLDELEASDDVSANADQMRVLSELDAFENTWFPRTRAIIRRAAPKASRDTFAEVFFRDLEQQPLGPGVIGSVSTFIARVEELSTSKLPGAADVRVMLVERGLTTQKISSIKALIESVQESAAAPASVSLEARNEAALAQVEALSELTDWFHDWGTMLRPLFNRSELIALGLSEARHSTRPGSGEDGGEGDEGEDGDEDPPHDGDATGGDPTNDAREASGGTKSTPQAVARAAKPGKSRRLTLGGGG